MNSDWNYCIYPLWKALVQVTLILVVFSCLYYPEFSSCNLGDCQIMLSRNKNLFDFNLINGPEVLSHYLIRHGALVKSFLRTLSVITLVSLWLLPLLELI